MFAKYLNDTWLFKDSSCPSLGLWICQDSFQRKLQWICKWQAPLFAHLESNAGQAGTLYPLLGQKGSPVMAREKIKILSGCPQGGESGSSSSGGEHLRFFCRNYLKPLSAHMWGWPISLSDWVNRGKRNVAQHQSPGGQNRSQLVLLTEAFMLQLNKSWGQTSRSSSVPRSGTETLRKHPAINEEEI